MGVVSYGEIGAPKAVYCPVGSYITSAERNAMGSRVGHVLLENL